MGDFNRRTVLAASAAPGATKERPCVTVLTRSEAAATYAPPIEGEPGSR